MTNFSRWSWLRTISQRVVLCERRDPSPLAPKVKKGLCSSAETRVRAAAMSAIALTLGSLRSRLCENLIGYSGGERALIRSDDGTRDGTIAIPIDIVSG